MKRPDPLTAFAAIPTFVLVFVLLFGAHILAKRDDEMGDLVERRQKACVAGAAGVAIVERALAAGDQEPAQDLMAYGEPWIEFCAPKVIEQLDGDLESQVRTLRLELDRRWR